MGKNQRGGTEILLAIMLIGISAAAVTSYLTLISNLQWTNQSVLLAGFRNMDNETAIETFMQAFRFAQLDYIQQTAACAAAKPLVLALREGTGCPGVGATLFSSATTATDPAAVDKLYTYTGNGCQLTDTTADCGSSHNALITMPGFSDADRLSKRTFEVAFLRSWPELKAAEFVLIERGSQIAINDTHFFVRDYFANAAHLEVDGRVTQENPDPTARCPGDLWNDYQLFDKTKKCIGFAELGGGTGLLFYHGRFFGFRPDDGTIIDMLSASASTAVNISSFVINPADGTVGGAGTPVFVPYPDPTNPLVSLANVDDLTMIDDQIYFVAGQGEDAFIGYAAPNGTRTPVCADLGKQGWAQGFAGIAALASSDALIPGSTNPLDSLLTQRFATFFLKTDSGDLLTAQVVSPSPGIFNCTVKKDPSLQQVEYGRTLGFDRVEDSKPFYIY